MYVFFCKFNIQKIQDFLIYNKIQFLWEPKKTI